MISWQPEAFQTSMCRGSRTRLPALSPMCWCPNDWSSKVSLFQILQIPRVGFLPPKSCFFIWIWLKFHCPECVGRWKPFWIIFIDIFSKMGWLTSGHCTFIQVVSLFPPRLQPLCQALHHDPRAKCLFLRIGLHLHHRCGWMGEVWGSMEIYPSRKRIHIPPKRVSAGKSSTQICPIRGILC